MGIIIQPISWGCEDKMTRYMNASLREHPIQDEYYVRSYSYSFIQHIFINWLQYANINWATYPEFIIVITTTIGHYHHTITLYGI